MLRFPFAKINLGLNICQKRQDGYHNIETALFPIDLCDALEILPSEETKLEILGTEPSLTNAENTCIKAWNILHEKHQVPPVDIILLKKIPAGAGLGGGSSDGSFMLMMLNDLFSLGLNQQTLETYALEIGTDSPFFIGSKPVIASGRGEIFEPYADQLKNKLIVLVKPPFSISTIEAYKNAIPVIWAHPLREILSEEIYQWKDKLQNDFEPGLFPKFPILGEIKHKLYDLGAIYASLSGSGSVVYGIFDHLPEVTQLEKFGTCMVSKSLNR